MSPVVASRVTERIRAFNHNREPERLTLKYHAMRGSALAFFRGTCHLFYEDWPPDSPLNDAPLAWISGDLHIENFGSFRGDNRLVYFDINDFDEAVLAPATWEVARLLTSIHLAAQGAGLGPRVAKGLCGRFLARYRELDTVHTGAGGNVKRLTVFGPSAVRRCLGRLDRAEMLAIG